MATTTKTQVNRVSVVNSLLAGYAAGMCGTLVGHPMDSCKVWLQTSSSSSAASTPLPTAMRVRSLYAGITGPLLTVGLLQSLQFAVYDAVLRVLRHKDHDGAANSINTTKPENAPPPLWHVALAGMAAGSALAVCSNPILLLKTRQQVAAKTNRGISMRQAFVTTAWPVHQNKSTLPHLSNLYTGFGPHWLAVTMGRAIWLTTYENLKRRLLESKQRQQQQQQQVRITLPERMACAALAGMLEWSIIFPLDTLRSRMYAGQPIEMRSSAPNGIRWAVLRNLYGGFPYALLRSGPIAAAILPVYDLALERLQQRTPAAVQ